MQQDREFAESERMEVIRRKAMQNKTPITLQARVGEGVVIVEPPPVKRVEPAKVKKKVIACWVCRRSFKTVEKLRHHEKSSAMHAEKLAAKLAAKAAVG